MCPAIDPVSLCASALLIGKVMVTKINAKKIFLFLAILDFINKPLVSVLDKTFGPVAIPRRRSHARLLERFLSFNESNRNGR
jgi:hypothetical protein